MRDLVLEQLLSLFPSYAAALVKRVDLLQLVTLPESTMVLAIVVMSEEKAKELGVTPMATWVAGALGGVEPEIMGVGPCCFYKKVLAKTRLFHR